MTAAALRFAFIPDPTRRGPCAVLPLLRQLWDEGHLVCFRKDFGNRTEELGNCHDVTASLLADLIRAGVDDGWRYVNATFRRDDGSEYGHTWLEVDGWAVDGSFRSLSGRVFVAPAKMYRSQLARVHWDHTAAELLAMPDEEGEGDTWEG